MGNSSVQSAAVLKLPSGAANVGSSSGSSVETELAKRVRVFDREKLFYPDSLNEVRTLLPDIYATSRGYLTTFNPRSREPLWDGVYYVDPRVGDDEESGLGWGSAFKTLSHALGLVGKNKIVVSPGHYDYESGWAGLKVSKTVGVVCEGGIAYFTNDIKGRNWVEDTENQGVYIADTVVGSENIFSFSVTGRFIADSRVDSFGMALSDRTRGQLEGGDFGINKGVAVTRVRLPGNANPNRFLRLSRRDTNIYCDSGLDEASFYFENIVTDYGFPRGWELRTNNVNSAITLINCGSEASFSDDGIYISSLGTVVTWRCSARDSWTDGISYHSAPGYSGVSDLQIFEYAGDFSNNGKSVDGSTSNNGSTIHDGSIIRLNTKALSNQHRCIHDVGVKGTVYSYNVGVVSGDSKTNFESFVVDFGVETGGFERGVSAWLVGCDLDTIKILSSNGSISIANDTVFASVDNSAGGEVNMNYEPVSL